VTVIQPATAPICRASHRRPRPWLRNALKTLRITVWTAAGVIAVFDVWVGVQALMGAAQLKGWT
jgi:hypothetical protein